MFLETKWCTETFLHVEGFSRQSLFDLLAKRGYVMNKSCFSDAVYRVLIVAAVTLIASSAFAQGPQTPSCGTFIVEKDSTIEGHLFTKGTYKINAIGISCEKVMGKYGLFDQFLSQDKSTPLPKPWKYLSEAVGAPKFVVAPGVGFRAQRIGD